MSHAHPPALAGLLVILVTLVTASLPAAETHYLVGASLTDRWSGDVAVVPLEARHGACEPQVVMFVHEADGPRNQVAKVFRLQVESVGDIREPRMIRNATVSWNGDAVTAADPEGRSLTLRVHGATGRVGSEVVEGFGLASLPGTEDLKFPAATLTGAEWEDFSRAAASLLVDCSTFECRSGGEGAAQCSYTAGEDTCTITCESGAIPCCGFSDEDGKPCCRCMQPHDE